MTKIIIILFVFWIESNFAQNANNYIEKNRTITNITHRYTSGSIRYIYTAGQSLTGMMGVTPYKKYIGFLYLLIKNNPFKYEIIGRNVVLCNLNLYNNDSITIKVYDQYNNPIKNIRINGEIIEKPDGTSNDTLFITNTNASGLAFVAFKTGDKSGAYIVKCSITGLSPVYINYNTDEYLLPAKTWRMIG